MKYIVLTMMAVMTAVVSMAQPKANYYSSSTLDGKNSRELEMALKAIVYPHTALDYGELWNAYKTTDAGPVDSIPSAYKGGKTDLVYDMYAWMKDYPKFYSDNDHTQTGGFNREHCVPNSWWGGESGNSRAYTDLHNVIPADGAANNAKGNYALGEYVDGMKLVWPTETKENTKGETFMAKDSHTHTAAGECKENASHVWKTGNSPAYGGSVNVFEPADEYKGDFARMYLYLVCAYEGLLNWETTYMFTSDSEKLTTIKPWAKELLLKWHRQDRVSKKERDRNNAVEEIQGNRNPFIDYPELVEYIWGNKSSESFTLANAVSAYSSEYISGTDKKKATLMLTMRARVGEPFNSFIFNSNSNGTATYSSSNTDVAEVDAVKGHVTIKSVGETVITYSITGTDAFEALTEQYKIVVE